MPSIIKSLLQPKQRKPQTPKKENILSSWFSTSKTVVDHDDADEPVQLKSKRKGIFETIRSGFKKLSIHDEPAKAHHHDRGVSIFAIPHPNPLQQLQMQVDAEFDRLLGQANDEANIDILLANFNEPVGQMMQQLDQVLCQHLGIPKPQAEDEEAVKYCTSVYESRFTTAPVQPAEVETIEPEVSVVAFAQQVEQARMEFIEGVIVNNVNLSRRSSADSGNDDKMARSDSFGLNWLMDDTDGEEQMIVSPLLY